MYRIISITGLLIVFGGICVHCLASAISRGYRWRPINLLKTLVHLFTLLFLEQKLNVVGVLRKLLYLLALLCFVILVITGFYPVLIHDEHLTGYFLMVHAAFAPVFAACLAALAVLWADNCRFDKPYWPWLQRVLGREAVSKAVIEKYEMPQKMCFWLIVILALPTILSIILSVFPLLGTKWQEFLLDIHRYSALLLALAAIVYIYLLIRTRMEQQ